MDELFTHFPEILSAVVLVLGGQKGFEFYQRKKYQNGNGRERRSNSFAISDKTFIQNCFETQTKELGMSMKNDRLEFAADLKDFIRADGESTRTAVRTQ